MNGYIEADVINYSLTDSDYDYINENIKKFLEDSDAEFGDFFSFIVPEGDIEVWIKDMDSKPVIDCIIFWGRDRDGAEYDVEIEYDESRIII